MLPHRWARAAVVAASLTLMLAVTPAAVAEDDVPSPPAPTAPCDAVSPIAIPCIALGKTFDALGAECRRVGIPDTLCVLPLAHKVTQAARDAYLRSWVHQAATFQRELGDPLPLRDAQWIGTHNSFNSLAAGLTLSHLDSNQQLSLAQQLDIDVRSIELDLHWIPRLELLGKRAVTVCHGQGNIGCTTEPTFAKVLPEVAGWLNAPAHRDEMLMLYLEDQLDNPTAYASAVATLDSVLRRPDGSSLVYRPDPAQKADNGCVPLPMDVSRADVRASGARVVVVGSCAPGWSSLVFDWSPTHVEGGSTAAYAPYPACDATYGDDVYAAQLVRYFEDSTLVSALRDPLRAPADPDALSPRKVHSMTACGVNLFGLDQLLPEDGRIQATLWSWAPDEPRTDVGACTLQRPSDGRWVAAACTETHRAACRSGDAWTVTPTPVTFADAEPACAAVGATFDLPRAGDQNSALHEVAAPVGGTWVDYSTQ